MAPPNRRLGECKNTLQGLQRVFLILHQVRLRPFVLWLVFTLWGVGVEDDAGAIVCYRARNERPGGGI